MVDINLLKQLIEYLASDSHFFVKCDALAIFKSIEKLSERELARLVGRSKSEVHRMLDVTKADSDLREAVIQHKTDYHVLVRYFQTTGSNQNKMYPLIINGTIKRHKEANSFLVDNKPSPKESLQRKHDLLERQLKKCKMELEKVA